MSSVNTCYNLRNYCKRCKLGGQSLCVGRSLPTSTGMYIVLVKAPTYSVQADMSHLEPGTVVRVMDDMAEMKKLQHGWGDWSDPMENVSAPLTSDL